MKMVGRSDWSDLLSHHLAKVVAQFFGRLFPCNQRHIAVDALTLDIMRKAHDRRLADQRMQHECAFDLGRSHAMA